MGKRLVIQKQDAVYHIICRTAYQMHKLSDESKSVFTALIKKQARFSGGEVITYCLLDSHIHLLVKIPYLKEITDQELVSRHSALYGEKGTEYTLSEKRLLKLLKDGGEIAVKIRNRLKARMQNLSVFVKELKHRFGLWFNNRHQNSGTLWSAKFQSILIENSVPVIAAVAAYIELNPVRLQLCQAPEDYPHSNFKNNRYYSSIKDKESLCQLAQKIRGMSHGKIMGSYDFVESWHTQQKSKWVSTALEKMLWVCLSSTEYHLHKKSWDYHGE